MKLLDEVRAKIRTLHYSYRTEQTYLRWIVAFIRFHQLRHPNTMGSPEIEEFLTHLAAKRKGSASTQNQALNAIVFLHGQILTRDPGRFNVIRACRDETEGEVGTERGKRLPVVLFAFGTLSGATY